MRIKKVATECIIRNGGALGHGHGIRKIMLSWINHELGPNGLALIKAMKQQLDRKGIMNPCKLLYTS